MTAADIRRRLAELSALPAEEARSMPPAYYTSPEFLAEEEAALRREWLCIGHAGEARGPGDYFTTEILGEQLLVARDEAGALRVLSNICRHRGGQIMSGAGHARAFTCSYHNWRYDLAGRLTVAPLMKDRAGFDQAGCALPEFRAEIWRGWIFVNLDGSAAPLGPQLTKLDGVVRNYHPEDRFLVFMEEDRWACNWKALFENFMEGYHLSATHLETLHPITPTKLCRKMAVDAAYTGYHAHYDPAYPPRGPFHPDLTAEERANSPMYGIFPNLVVGMATNFTLFMCLRPDGPDGVKIRWGVTGLEDAPEAEAVRAYVQLCREFNAEDQAKLESLQIAYRTRNFDGGPLAPDDYEGAIWDFLLWMAGRMPARS